MSDEFIENYITQLTFTCSESTIETLEKGQRRSGEFACSKLTIETQETECNMFKVNNKDTRTTSMLLYCYLWTYFTPFSSFSIVEFEQVNVSRAVRTLLWKKSTWWYIFKTFSYTRRYFYFTPPLKNFYHQKLITYVEQVP